MTAARPSTRLHPVNELDRLGKFALLTLWGETAKLPNANREAVVLHALRYALARVYLNKGERGEVQCPSFAYSQLLTLNDAAVAAGIVEGPALNDVLRVAAAQAEADAATANRPLTTSQGS